MSKTAPARALTQIDLPPEAVDRIYAQSLFELAEKQGGVELLQQIAEEMDEVAGSARQDPQSSEFFASKIITPAEKAQVVDKVLRGKISEIHLNFTLLLVKRERLDRYRRITTAFDELMQERFGKIEVDVYTRYPLERDEVDSIRTRLQHVMKREPVLHAYTDTNMIGGMRIQIGDQLLDATVDAHLRRIREQLLSQGGSALRSRMDRIIQD